MVLTFSEGKVGIFVFVLSQCSRLTTYNTDASAFGLSCICRTNGLSAFGPEGSLDYMDVC